MADKLLEIKGVSKIFRVGGMIRGKKLVAVDDVTLSIDNDKPVILSVVGESGCGKSTLCKMVLRLHNPDMGDIVLDGKSYRDKKSYNAKQFKLDVQPIFQNPYGSLDPMYSVYNTIAEPLRIHGIGDEKSRQARVNELLDRVSIPRPMAHRYPGELSGGQRQRVAIARALALNPEMVVCDEAVSALDVLVQSQILDLLNSLQAELGLSYLIINQDLAEVKQIADQVLVMEKGRIVETGRTDELFENPSEEYTRRLLDSIPGGSIELHAG